MSAASLSLSGSSLTRVQDQFVAELPRITAVLRFRFRRWPARRRAEAVADATAAAWHAWVGLARRGRDPAQVGPTGIAANAARYVRNGRRLGTGTVGRGAMDIYRAHARGRPGIELISLDRPAAPGPGPDPDCWREGLAEDRSTSPADAAAFRLDFQGWLGRLPDRTRRIALLLAEGGSTGEVARAMGVTPGAISQTRGRLERSWGAFQAQAARP